VDVVVELPVVASRRMERDGTPIIVVPEVLELPDVLDDELDPVVVEVVEISGLPESDRSSV